MDEYAMVMASAGVVAAAGAFGPGHLGELTRYLPFELVDDVLARAGAVQERLRLLPSRAGVYFVLALVMFAGAGYLLVWDELTAGLERAGIAVAHPSEKALRDLRRRVGPAPLKMLFESVAVPLAPPGAPGVSWRGLRTVAFDGLSSVKVPDSARNLAWLGKPASRTGVTGYPAVRVVALAETGTRGLLGAVTGGAGERSEVVLARKLVPLLRKGMLLLGDRAYDAAGLLEAAAATGAHFLVRGKSARRPPVLEVHPDGSYRSRIETRTGWLEVRIVEADLAVHGADGSRAGDSYRLLTSLLDWRRYPAAALVRLYHERWEIEVSCLALRHTLLKGRVLRSRDRPGAEQELWALLALYQALRMAMTDAALSAGAGPGRASFTVALETARKQVTLAAGIGGTPSPRDTGQIGRKVIRRLLPARRPRYSDRKVKCPASRWSAASPGRPALPVTITKVTITISTPRPDRPSARPRNPAPGPRPLTLRDQVTAIMTSEPGTSHHATGLATRTGTTRQQMAFRLAEWARKGFITRTSRGHYTIPATPATQTTKSTPDPLPSTPSHLDKPAHTLTTRHCHLTCSELPAPSGHRPTQRQRHGRSPSL